MLSLRIERGRPAGERGRLLRGKWMNEGRAIALAGIMALGAALAGCASTGTGHGTGRGTGEATRSTCDRSPSSLEDALNRLLEADNARNVEAVLAGYTDDVVWLPPTGDVIEGKEAIRARYETMFAAFAVDMTSEVFEARTAGSGEIGYLRGTTHGTLSAVNGGAITRVRDKFVAMVRCESGTWLVSHLMWSPL